MADIGNTLREARIRKGFTIKDVEAVTKIRSKYLEALEQDDFSVLPGPTFVSAFLRNYASYLKLDADALVDEYRRRHEPRSEEAERAAGGAVEAQPIARRGRAPEAQDPAQPAGIHLRRRPRDHRHDRARLVGPTGGAGRGDSRLRQHSRSESIDYAVSADVSSTTTEAGSQASTTTTSVVVSGENITAGAHRDRRAVAGWSCAKTARTGPSSMRARSRQGGQKTFDSSKRYWMNVGKPERAGSDGERHVGELCHRRPARSS